MKIFSKLLDESFKALSEFKPSSKTNYRFTPSTLGAKCERKVFYEYTRAPKEQEDTPIATRRATVIGRYYGQMFFDLLEKSGKLVKYIQPDGKPIIDKSGKPDYEFRVSAPELGIEEGKIDAVTVVNKKIYLGEAKSASSNSYSRLLQEGISQSNYFQSLIYLYLFNRDLKNGKFAHIKELDGITEAEGISLIVFNKGGNTFKEFFIGKNDKNFKDLVQRIVRVKAHAEKQTLPPKKEDFCNHCPFRKICDKNQVK